MTSLLPATNVFHAHPHPAARLLLASNFNCPSGVNTAVPADGVDYDFCGAYRGTAGRLYVPPDADLVRVTANVYFNPSNSGTVRFAQIWKNGSFLGQDGPKPLGNVYATTATITRTFQVNQPGDADTYFEVKAYHDTGSNLAVLASSELFLEVLSRKPYYTTGPALKTVQGFFWNGQLQSWEHILANQFDNDYGALVSRLASFDVLNLGSVIGWGPGTDFPHPKTFAGSYTPLSPAFAFAGKTGPELLADLKSENPDVQIYLYTTPQLDHTENAWNASTGVPTQVTTWSPQSNGDRWANYLNSIEAMRAGGDHLFDGIYLDLMGPGGIDRAKFDEAVLVAKRLGKSVMLNGVGASLSVAQFQLACPYLTYGDWIYCEGFSFDSTNGSTTTASTQVAALMAKQAGRGLRFACVVEELGETTDAGMETGTPATHLADGTALFNTYRQPGWALEHQRQQYDYIGTPLA